jgi:hypothetical protein
MRCRLRIATARSGADTLFSLGPSGQPHFALFCDSDLNNRLDHNFLAVRLLVIQFLRGQPYWPELTKRPPGTQDTVPNMGGEQNQ